MGAYKKSIICLANSRRPGGTCVAGKELVDGQIANWIRPINKAHSGAISGNDRLYADRSHAELLDLVKVPLSAPAPHLHHREDHQIDASLYWEKIRRASWEDVEKATDAVNGNLWVNEGSSFHGVNDKVSEDSAAKLGGSLYLIKPEKLTLNVAMESAFGGGSVRKLRAVFAYNGVGYNFVVTDEPVEQLYFGKGDGAYKITNDVRLSVSLAEILGGNATKLVAAVITPDRI